MFILKYAIYLITKDKAGNIPKGRKNFRVRIRFQIGKILVETDVKVD